MKQEIDQALFAAQFVQNPWYPVAEPSDAQASADMADASRDLTAKLVKLVQAMQEIKAEEDSRVNSYEIFVNQKQTHIRNSRGVDVTFSGFDCEIEVVTNSRKDDHEIEIYKDLRFSDKSAEKIIAEVRGRFQVLSELTRLRQLCCDPALVYENYEGGSAKLDLCIELIQSAVESGHKILLFSQFTSMIEILTARLQEESISCFVLQGSTKKEQRAQMVEQFNRDDTSVFCISLKAGGTGLNLTGADIVIHYDPWWNVAVENQATDRAHRIGQKNVVTVYKLIAKGTIEEKIIKLQQMKKELAEEILSGDEIKTASFQREELLELLEERF